MDPNQRFPTASGGQVQYAQSLVEWGPHHDDADHPILGYVPMPAAPIALRRGGGDGDVDVDSGRIRALVVIEAGGHAIRIHWPRTVAALLVYHKALGTAMVHKLLPWALQLLQSPVAIAPGCVHTQREGDRISDATYFFTTTPSPMADAILHVLQAAGIRQVAMSRDNPLFGFTTRPSAYFEEDGFHLQEPMPGVPTNVLALDHPLVSSLLFYDESSLRTAMETSDLPVALQTSRALAELLPHDLAQGLGHALADFTVQERKWIAPVWDLVRQMATSTGVDTISAPIVKCMAGDSMALDLRWTRKLQDKDVAGLEDAAQLTAVHGVLYVNSIAHRDVKTQPLVVAADYALLIRTLRALAKALGLAVLMRQNNRLQVLVTTTT